MPRAQLGTRREFLAGCAAALPRTGLAVTEPAPPLRPVRFGVSTYSFWQFRSEPAPIEACIAHAARMGFDGVEILQVQMMGDEANGRLQRLKRQAHSLGLALCGFSTQQGFVSPDPAVRQENVDKTFHSIDLAHRRVAEILRPARYQGWVSLEFGGEDDPLHAVPRNRAMLRDVFEGGMCSGPPDRAGSISLPAKKPASGAKGFVAL